MLPSSAMYHHICASNGRHLFWGHAEAPHGFLLRCHIAVLEPLHARQHFLYVFPGCNYLTEGTGEHVVLTTTRLTASSMKINCTFLWCFLSQYEGADVDAVLASYCTCWVKISEDLLTNISPTAEAAQCWWQDCANRELKNMQEETVASFLRYCKLVLREETRRIIQTAI